MGMVGSRSSGSSGSEAGVGVLLVGASGGVGASTLAVATGLAGCAAGLRAVLVDLQPGGPGLDVVLGVEHRPGLRWSDLAGVSGPVDGEGLLARLPAYEALPVLAHDRERPFAPEAGQVCDVLTGLRSTVDLLVLDACRSVVAAGPARLGIEPGDRAVLLATPTVVSLAGLGAIAPAVAYTVPETFVMLRGGSTARALVDGVQDCLDLPMLTCLGDDSGARAAVEQGRPPGRRPGPVAECAADLVAIAVPGGSRNGHTDSAGHTDGTDRTVGRAGRGMDGRSRGQGRGWGVARRRRRSESGAGAGAGLPGNAGVERPSRVQP